MKPNTRVIVAVTHELLNAAHFSDRGSLIDVVKVRCAKLRIPYDSASVERAIKSIEGAGQRHDVPGWAAEPAAERRHDAPADDPGVGRSEAAAILGRIRARMPAAGPKPMPAVDLAAIEDASARRAELLATGQAVAREILATIDRCEALEAQIPPKESPHVASDQGSDEKTPPARARRRRIQPADRSRHGKHRHSRKTARR